MNQSIKKQLTQEIRHRSFLKSHFERELKNITPDINNAKFLKFLSKLSQIDSQILFLEKALREYNRQHNISRRLRVAINSRVKLISLDFKVVLWVDASNLNTLIGKSMGDIVNLYNANFKIAGVY